LGGLVPGVVKIPLDADPVHVVFVENPEHYVEVDTDWCLKVRLVNGKITET